MAYEGLTQGVGEKVSLDQLTKVSGARFSPDSWMALAPDLVSCDSSLDVI